MGRDARAGHPLRPDQRSAQLYPLRHVHVRRPVRRPHDPRPKDPGRPHKALCLLRHIHLRFAQQESRSRPRLQSHVLRLLLVQLTPEIRLPPRRQSLVAAPFQYRCSANISVHNSLISPPIYQNADIFVLRLTVQSDKPMRRMSNFLSAQSTPTSPAPTEYSDAGRRIHTSASSTTLKDKRRAAETVVPPLPRPTTRPRGMTDVGPARRDLMSPPDTRLPPSAYPPPTPPATSNSTQPRVVVRQASLTRIQPPSAPPTSGLPPPPLVTGSSSTKSSSLRLQPPSPSSASSSSLSFASSLSSRDAVHSSVSHHSDRHNIKEKKRFSNERYMSEHGKERGRDKHAGPRNDANGPTSSRHHREPSSPRTVKKAASQQTLSKHFPGMGAASTSSIATEDGKALKKQRSFHTSRIPMPPLPAPFRHVNSFLPQGSSAREEPPLTKEQRRGSTQSTSGHTNQPAVRKRLFSGTSLRRSSSSQAHSTTDDDAHSVFSLPIQDESPSFVNPFHSSDHVTSSFWDEATDPITGPPTSPNRDYYAQQIMSPAEMLRLEALVQKGGPDADIGRPRVNSFASASTSMSNPLSDVVSVDIPLRPSFNICSILLPCPSSSCCCLLLRCSSH